MKLEKTIYIMSSILLMLTSLIMASGFLLSIMKDKSLFIEWEIFSINSASFVMSIIFDWKSLSFLTTVSMISSFIMIYSKYYMSGEKNFIRFTFILLAFVGSMMLLIISPNLVSLMLGWDGLGLTSYALVIFYQSEYSANSGMITILSNRVGDATLLLTIGGFLHLGSYNFIFMSSTEPIIIILIILSAFTKSAQIPFSAWLPAAMAAPTPVSALVHSSTLVTAGVFLMIRFMPIIKNSKLLLVAFIIGVLTMLMAGWSANFETDLKKVVALSTLSQLGLMFTILGLGSDLLAFFHLIMHALFKSSLFMCAGFIIHNMNSSQDSRFAGTFNFSSPTLGLVFGCTNLSLCGFPFMTGFFSKDMILEKTFNVFNNNFVYTLIVLSTGLTLSYSIRAIYMTASETSKTPTLMTSSDFSSTLMKSTMFLFIMSIAGGYILSLLMLTKGFMLSMITIKKFSIIMIIIMMTILMMTMMTLKFNLLMKTKKWAASLMIFLPNMTKHPMTLLIMKSGVNSLKLNDKGWFEYSGPSAMAQSMKNISLVVNKSNMMSMVTLYVLSFMLIMLIMFMVYCFLY